jgi:hypothetical protein
MDEKIVTLSRMMRMDALTSPAAHSFPGISYVVSVLILMMAMVAIMVDGIVIVVDIASAFALLPRVYPLSTDYSRPCL